MTIGTMKIIGIALGLSLGHFAFQALIGPYDWGIASERSFFTIVAAIAIWLAIRGEFRRDR